ncbi:DUF4328 domain-containing protein [Sabulilitoribacter multivorans]|uniref:DUF4328 domain-containing protein n=1 Tax=Flaviramulus multivorans TaxID=1304750 RepID=A0ABS9ILQ8_9FLAO|nr:DUF4328 domain-containing protein [Flaviramulus multivorans]MCF7561492.1 DUF4328 domain-containing protein [Flaviramulus multivorans]
MDLIRDNSQRSKYVLVLLGILAFFDLLSVGFNYYQNMVLEGYEFGEYTDEYIENLDYLSIVISLTYFSSFIITIVLFIQWFRRAYGNLIRLDVNMEYTENGSVWGYFIPFINWVRPIKTMKEIYLKTQKVIKEYNSTLVFNKNTEFIVVWWVIYLINGFIANFASKQMNRATTIDEFISANNVYIFSDLVDVVSIGFAILVIQKVSKLELILRETDTSLSLINQIGVKAEV